MILGALLVAIGAGGLFFRSKISPAQAGLQIETTPQATVFIGEEEVGTTPFDKAMSPGEITLRLVPIATNGPLSPWTTKLTLTQGVKTIVRRQFGATESLSAGEVLSFEKIPGNSASLAIVSSPDSADIVLDGESIGFTPSRRDSLPAGRHQIRVSRPGFLEREIAVTTEPGYKLTVVAFLGETAESSLPTDATASGEPEVEPSKTLVEILNTPTGFLRVREEPTTTATESAKVDPGKKYPYLDKNKDGTWFKIEYEKGKEGWISAQYAKKTTSSE